MSRQKIGTWWVCWQDCVKLDNTDWCEVVVTDYKQKCGRGLWRMCRGGWAEDWQAEQSFAFRVTFKVTDCDWGVEKDGVGTIEDEVWTALLIRGIVNNRSFPDNETWPYSLFLTSNREPRILMSAWGTPDGMRDHHSLRSIDSHFLSFGDMSGLIMTGEPCGEPLVDKTPVARINLTRRGRGLPLSAENLPRRKMPLMEWEYWFIPDITETAFLRSSSRRVDFDAPLGLSSSPYKTTLHSLLATIIVHYWAGWRDGCLTIYRRDSRRGQIGLSLWRGPKWGWHSRL